MHPEPAPVVRHRHIVVLLPVGPALGQFLIPAGQLGTVQNRF
jgi:hypothetical protein